MRSFNSVPETVWLRATCVSGLTLYDVGWARSAGFSPGQYATASATCGSLVAMGGGYRTTLGFMPIVQSSLSGNGWTVRAFNGYTIHDSFEVLVSCASGRNLGTRFVIPENTTVPANGGFAFPINDCPSGTWLASGGYRHLNGDTNWTIVTGSLPHSGNPLSWKWNLKNGDSIPHTYERTRVCFNL